jgi:DNA-binding transcriptional regulator PaaX
MKLPITDKFLLDLFNFFQGADRAFDLFAPRTMKEALLPDLLKFRRERGRQFERKRFNSLIYYLKRKGYITITNLQEKKGVMFTQRGAQKTLKIKLKDLSKKKRPDGKWEMIIFDIPEKKRGLRDMLRQFLVLLGYEQLQESVWVSPYDVFKETSNFLREYSLDLYVKLFLIEEIER